MREKVCIHCYVTGKVQGVFFRAATQAQAFDLGVTGWVKNLPDGRVELMACGEKEKLTELYIWLKGGPERAVVKEVSYEELPWQVFDRFKLM